MLLEGITGQSLPMDRLVVVKPIPWKDISIIQIRPEKRLRHNLNLEITKVSFQEQFDNCLI